MQSVVFVSRDYHVSICLTNVRLIKWTLQFWTDCGILYYFSHCLTRMDQGWWTRRRSWRWFFGNEYGKLCYFKSVSGNKLWVETENDTNTVILRHTVYLLLLVTAAALLLACVQLLLTRMFTRMIMHVTLILSILLNIGICVYYWITKYYCESLSLPHWFPTTRLILIFSTAGAIIFTIIAILSVISYWGFRSRIPLASLLLQIVIDVSKHHKSVYVVAFLSLIIQAALSVWFSFVAIAT